MYKVSASEIVLGILKFRLSLIIIANSENLSLQPKMLGDFVNDFANVISVMSTVIL